MTLERRREDRRKPNGRTLVRLDGVSSSLFHLVDISPGGCAFRYLGSDKLDQEAGVVDIACDQEELMQIPFQAVCDCEVDYGYIPMRRRGLRFGALSENQKRAVEKLISRCAAEGH